MAVGVRATRVEEGPKLRQIERLAGERFRDVGLGDVADHEPPSAAALAEYAADHHSWVAVDDADEPIGYVIVEIVDGDVHLEQLSVRPDQQGQGIGRALIEHVEAWTIENGRTGLTLTTFNRVAWNRPLFERLGFRVLREDEIGPGLRATRQAEAIRGLDPTVRVCMRRAVTG